MPPSRQLGRTKFNVMVTPAFAAVIRAAAIADGADSVSDWMRELVVERLQSNRPRETVYSQTVDLSKVNFSGREPGPRGRWRHRGTTDYTTIGGRFRQPA